MILANPLLLVAGLAVALLLVLGQYSRARRRRHLADALGGRRAGRRLSPSSLYRFPLERAGIVMLAALAVGAAAAEPRRPAEVTEPPPPPKIRSVVIALDVSASMQATDADPTRLGHAVRIAEGLIDALDRDRIGLTLFAGEAYPLAPPTPDHAALRYLLMGVTPTVASAHDPGTLLSVGIDSAADLLGVSEPDSAIAIADEGERTIILIGDGEAGELDNVIAESARQIAAQGIAIHTIGVGTPDGAGMVMPSAPFQLGGRIVDGGGAPVISHLREPTLAGLAEAGRGRHVNATDESALRDFLASLEYPSTEPPPSDPESLWERYEPAVWLIVVALVCLVLESLADVRIPWAGHPLARREA